MPMSQPTAKKKPVEFTEAQLSMIDQGLAEFASREGMTSEETKNLAKKGADAWATAKQDSQP
jgi:predicted transcriptional regulator